MMANWDLATLDRAITRLATPTLLVVGSEDKAISPDTAFALKKRLTHARVELMRGLGHLAHEEAPEKVAEVIFGAMDLAVGEGVGVTVLP